MGLWHTHSLLMRVDPIQSAQAFWDSVAPDYDQVFPNKIIGRAQRQAVWHEIDQLFHPGQRVLELNCGTGIDAVHLALNGVRVLACDLSTGMIEAARRRLASTALAELVEFRVLPTENLASLAGPFDGAFSNFSGLNCVQDLSAAARELARLLHPGAHVLICVVNRLVPWELLWHFAHGEPRRAVRRFRSTSVSQDGQVPVYNHSVAAMRRVFAPDFQLRGRRAIGVLMPSPQFERWAGRFPRVFAQLAHADLRVGGWPILRGLGDCVLLHFERVRP